MAENNKPQAVLFDLDGTLIDSLADLGGAVNKTLADLGFPGHQVEDYRQFIGEGARRLVERALPAGVRQDEALVERALKLYQSHYEAGWHTLTTVYPGVEKVLEVLKSKGVKMGVISNKPHHFTRLCVAHFFPEAGFDVVLGQRDEVPRKPDPAAAREAAATLGVQTGDCVYAGDSGIDMAFAKAAGMTAIGVLWGFRDEAELLANGADELAKNAEQLLALLT